MNRFAPIKSLAKHGATKSTRLIRDQMQSDEKCKHIERQKCSNESPPKKIV